MFLSEKKNFIIQDSKEFKFEACMEKCSVKGRKGPDLTPACMKNCYEKFDEASLFVIMKFLDIQKLL